MCWHKGKLEIITKRKANNFYLPKLWSEESQENGKG